MPVLIDALPRMIDRLPLLHAMLCCRHHQPLSDTEQYIEKISSLDERYELFMELKLFRKAADTANRLKDPAKLQEVGTSTAHIVW